MLSFIDFIDKYNRKVKPPTTSEKTTNNTNLDYLNKREKLYSKFLFFKNFMLNKKTTIITEGVTDPIYLKCALRSLSSEYPTLVNIAESDQKFTLLLDFFTKQENQNKMNHFLKLQAGTGNIKNFIEDYNKNYKRYYGNIAQHPVIIILDNDSGCEGIIKLLNNKKFIKNSTYSKNIRETEKYIHVIHNLYIILTPLLDKKADSAIEDLFPSEILEEKIDGKTFNRTNQNCSETEYGKTVFSKKVIMNKQNEIDFSKFKYIFDLMKGVIEDYQLNKEK